MRQNQTKSRTYKVGPGDHAPDALAPIALVVFPAGARKNPVCASSCVDCIYHSVRTGLSTRVEWRGLEGRLPGLPIRDCARGCNNRAQMCVQLSALAVRERHFLTFVFGSRIAQNCALCQLSVCTHKFDHSLHNYFSISVNFFPRMAPHFFCP